MLATKQCTVCNTTKNKSEFYKKPQGIDRLRPNCKECQKIQVSLYAKTKAGIATRIYGHQVEKSKRRKHNPPTYTKEYFKGWLFGQSLFHALYNDWIESNCNPRLKPSVDRLDDYTGYTESNIRVCTWQENNIKAYQDRKNGINNKANQKVRQYTLDGEFICDYHSMHEAERITGIRCNHIHEYCRGKRKTAGDFRWSFL